MFDHVFSPITIKGKTIKNRFTVPAMVCNFCNKDGTATERYIAYHEAKAKGGWGLIITEDYNVSPEGHGFSCTAGLWNDGQIASHSELPKRVHKYGATILAQIYHCGRQTHKSAIPEGCHTRSSSAILCPFGDEIPIPFTTEEVKGMVKKYGDAAVRAKKCGFDGVEIHSAHGYLLNQFYSPLYNHRTDEYGCDTMENRIRMHLEIIQSIRGSLGTEYPIAIRMGGCDYQEGGTSVEDTVEACKILEKSGVDLLDITGGMNGFIRPGHTEAGYFRDISTAVKKQVDIPVLLTGGVKSVEDAEALIQDQCTDMVGIGRVLLKNPQALHLCQ